MVEIKKLGLIEILSLTQNYKISIAQIIKGLTQSVRPKNM